MYIDEDSGSTFLQPARLLPLNASHGIAALIQGYANKNDVLFDESLKNDLKNVVEFESSCRVEFENACQSVKIAFCPCP